MTLKRIATHKSAEKGKAIVIEIHGRQIELSHADLTTHNTAEKILTELERQAGRTLGLFLHVNRDGSIAVATGAEPVVWPEDSPKE